MSDKYHFPTNAQLSMLKRWAGAQTDVRAVTMETTIPGGRVDCTVTIANSDSDRGRAHALADEMREEWGSVPGCFFVRFIPRYQYDYCNFVYKCSENCGREWQVARHDGPLPHLGESMSDQKVHISRACAYCAAHAYHQVRQSEAAAEEELKTTAAVQALSPDMFAARMRRRRSERMRRKRGEREIMGKPITKAELPDDAIDAMRVGYSAQYKATLRGELTDLELHSLREVVPVGVSREQLNAALEGAEHDDDKT